MYGEKNNNGQLGIGNTINQLTPKKLDFKAKEIKLRPENSFAIGEDGFLYSWGDTLLGQLGRNGNQLVPQQVLIPNGEKTISFYLGNNYTIALTEGRNLYSFGYNADGQLGIGNKINQSYPALIKNSNAMKFKEISLNTHHSLGITEIGDVYSWGDGSNGELGISTSYLYTPSYVRFPKNIKAKKNICRIKLFHCFDRGWRSLYIWA